MSDWDDMWDKPFAGTDAERLTIDQRIAQVKAEIARYAGMYERSGSRVNPQIAAQHMDCMLEVLDELLREKYGRVPGTGDQVH